MYMFEWATPVVCPEILTTDGCSLHVSQLQYTFNLTSLSGAVQVCVFPCAYTQAHPMLPMDVCVVVKVKMVSCRLPGAH